LCSELFAFRFQGFAFRFFRNGMDRKPFALCPPVFGLPFWLNPKGRRLNGNGLALFQKPFSVNQKDFFGF